MSEMYKKISKCRICNDKNLIDVCNFGEITLTGVFPKNKNKKLKKTPLQVVFSKKSKLLQLKHNYNLKKLFGFNYGYRSSLNVSMKNHLEKKYEKLIKKIDLRNNNNVLDIGSNDGTFLNFFDKGINKYGCDPTAKKFKKYYSPSVKIIPQIFNNKIKKILNKKFKLVTSIAMFYDLSNPIKFCKDVEKILDKNGIFHIEIAYLPDIIKTFSFDTFCQEHLTYYSLISFENLINKTNFKITDYSRNAINGGSINFDLAFKDSKFKQNSKKLNKLRKFELKNKLHKSQTYKNFFSKIKNNIKNINSIIQNISLKEKIYGFGASTKGNVTLQLCGLTGKNIEAIYDINKEKFNTYTPGSKIKIIDENKIKKLKPRYLILLIWHFKKTIREKLKKFNLKKTKLIWLFPKIKIAKY